MKNNTNAGRQVVASRMALMPTRCDDDVQKCGICKNHGGQNRTQNKKFKCHGAYVLRFLEVV